MADDLRIAFDQRVLSLSVSAILPLRTVSENARRSLKYKRILRSIVEVGLVEPLVVAPSKDTSGTHLLLDGHLRYTALLALNATEITCIVADDDEAFTYNKRINRLATIQEHYMIVRALERGVSEVKLARSLNIDVQAIKLRKSMLDGVCPEAVELLKDQAVNPVVFNVLRKLKPLRQIEAVELMTAAGNFSSTYAKALLAATRQTDLVKSDQPKKVAGLTPEQMARMEREMETLQRDFKAVEASYGDDVLHLVIASGYLAKLVRNTEIALYLEQHHTEIMAEFQSIITATSLYQKVSSP